MTATVIFALTYLLIATRRLGLLPIGRPAGALLGAVLMVAFGVLSPAESFAAINHDTIALLVLDENGDVSGGCSTSGAGGKLPGRVGDSPILGSGLYVDDQVGAAGATGIGENVMRYCGTYQIVEFMRQGMTPMQACEEVVHRIAAVDPRGYQLDICFVAVDRFGRYGAAASNMRFPFCVTDADGTRELSVEAVTPRR